MYLFVFGRGGIYVNKVELFKDISKRTDGDVYLGIVGAVRTGKSSFIKKFMELVVLPNIADENEKMRALDEIPQSAAGRTVMTTEPKFVPNQAVSLNLEEGLPVHVRMVDCVGYPVDGAKGFEDENGPRMIHTPWYDESIPFYDAAEIGTRKVIQDHSTIGVVVTTDGSFGEMGRDSYVEAEEKVIEELKDVGKPFIVVINSATPTMPETEALRQELMEYYDVPVINVNVETMTEKDIYNILREALFEFPVLEVNINLPSWVIVLDEEHWLKETYEGLMESTVQNIKRLRDVDQIVQQLTTHEYIEHAQIVHMEMGEGIAEINMEAPPHLYDTI